MRFPTRIASLKQGGNVEHHGHDHSHAHGDHSDGEQPSESLVEEHTGHAHTLMPVSSSTSADFGMLGVFLHLLGDAINNVAVMLSAVVIMTTSFRYADPIASLFVACMILLTAWPLIRKSGKVLLQSAPDQVDLEGLEKDVASVKNVKSMHECHVWNLSEWYNLYSRKLAN